MKRSIKSLIGYSMKETDGEIGKVDEFYFDDNSWTIRYLIVKTGNWLSGKKVLISPVVVQKPDWENKEFPVKLTKEQIQNSPDIDTDKPVTRQQEEQLSGYYPWGMYWGNEPDAHGAGIFGMMPGDLYEEEAGTNVVEEPAQPSENNDQHLRSTHYVTGYTIHASDGEIGKVKDFIIDDTNWQIKYLVVHTGNWLNSKEVLLSTKLITNVNWENANVIVNISKKDVEESPEFNADEPIK
ncbi:MAG: PRC-barrel domain-containing protein [Ginsengibacter sp.]